MPSWTSVALTLALLGCAADRPTAIVVAVATDLRIPYMTRLAASHNHTRGLSSLIGAKIAERLRKLVPETRLVPDQPDLEVTVSAGVASIPDPKITPWRS
jgi:hypothetical protein